MAHTRCTARKSTGRLPVGQLAPQHVPPPQEAQPNAPQEASHEEPFEIELVVPKGPTAEGSLAEEQQQSKDQDVEDEANKEYPPPSDTEDKKMYRDADEVGFFGAEALVLTAGFELCWSTWLSPPPLGTGSRKSRVQGGWSSKPS
jgi:hypothetical protein